MQLSATYVEYADYLRVNVAGEFTPSSARDVLLEWLEKAKGLNLNRVLTDATQIEGLKPGETAIMQRFDIAVFVAESLPLNFRFAILLAPEQMLDDRFEENVMVNRGVNVLMTTVESEAIEWLNGQSGDA